MARAEIQVHGARELQASLKRVSAELPKELRRRLKHDVADPIAQRAKAAVPRGPGDPPWPGARGRHWYQDIRSGSTSRGAYVQWGRDTTPYAGWMEFGGQLPSVRSGKPARQRRTRVKGGRYVFPQIAEGRNAAAAAAERVFRDVARRAQLTVK